MNGKVRIALGVVGAGIGVVVLGGLGGLFWVNSAVSSKLNATYDAHEVDFPIPFPLTEQEMEELKAERLAAVDSEGANDAEPEEDPLAGVDLDALAKERAIERGKYLVSAVYHCAECHGHDFAGGAMIDDPGVGQILGPNLTTGKGSKTLDYTPADWDRIVRHGIKPGGLPTPMPSVDFLAMSDRELSDIITYIRSLPPADKEVPPISLGPVGKILVATGALGFTADLVQDHHAEHTRLPPSPEDGLAYGKHLAQPCTGCHRVEFNGGPIPGGPPDWAPAANLTTALADWSFEDFQKAMRKGEKPDGSHLLMPMTITLPFNNNLKDDDMRAMFDFLKTLSPAETGQ